MAEITEKPQSMPFKSSIPDIESLFLDKKRARIKRYPQNNLRASSVGWPCDRYHYHSIKDWKEAPEHDVGLQIIFDEGDLHEGAVIAELNTLPGIRVIKQQVAFQLDKPLITGTIDGILVWEQDGVRHEKPYIAEYPFDVKSMSRFQFAKIRSAEDLINSPSPLFRKYVAQLQIYLLISGYEIGAFVLKCKDTGEIRVIWMQFDAAFIEGILQRSERVYASLKAEVPGERTKDIELCLKCPFRHICLPDIKFGEGVQMLGGQELQEILERRDQLQAAAKEFDELDKAVKKVAVETGVGEKVCGDFLIQVKEQNRKEYTVKASTFFTTKIVKLTKEPEAAEDV